MFYIQKNYIYVSLCIILGKLLFKNLFQFLKQSFKNDKNINWEIFPIPKEDINKEKYLFSEIDLNGKNKINKNDKINHKIVVGIDFGTVGSGYSYSLENDISKIKSMKKTPSEIILSKEKQNGLIYSYSAPITMMNYNQKELSKILYIKAIKSLINSKNETINDNLCYFFPNDITLNIRDDITSYFSMMKKDILKDLKVFNENQILWILAIPSNWDEFQKQLIHKSLIDSGITNIKMIYESEAASLSIFSDKYIDKVYKKRNNYFLLIDFRSSSASFSINKIEDNYGSIKPIFTFIKDDIGSNYITIEIINIFFSLIGNTTINQVKSNNPRSWIKFLKEINNAIENTKSINGREIFEITNIFNDESDKKFIYREIKYHLKFNKFIIQLPSILIGNIILNNISKINLYLDDMYINLKNSKINLNSVIITGGFSQNKIIKNEIYKYFEEKNIPISYILSYEYAISKGCVLYGINPEKLLPKKSSVTLGIFNFLKNKMEILIKKGDEIKNEINLVKFIKPQLENQKYVHIFIYITDKDINDNQELKGYLFGRFLIKTHKNIEKIQLIIKYDTYLTLSAINYDTGVLIESEFQFFNNDQIRIFSEILK